MRVCIQRVLEAEVKVDGISISKIGEGIIIFFGVLKGDKSESLDWLVDKIVNLRIFSDKSDKMTLSLKDINGEILIVSQFTLAGDCKKGRRPDFSNAEIPVEAERLYNILTNKLKITLGDSKVKTGVFGKDMKVSLTNCGPVTLIIDK